mmetsp:Transcript_2622/g.7798  ORF Transcript_2622/g.7798 Transcript_2622/m.7798 type:complete len:381 (+) Transcript_2622:644-1786(+)
MPLVPSSDTSAIPCCPGTARMSSSRLSPSSTASERQISCFMRRRSPVRRMHCANSRTSRSRMFRVGPTRSSSRTTFAARGDDSAISSSTELVVHRTCAPRTIFSIATEGTPACSASCSIVASTASWRLVVQPVASERSSSASSMQSAAESSSTAVSDQSTIPSLALSMASFLASASSAAAAMISTASARSRASAMRATRSDRSARRTTAAWEGSRTSSNASNRPSCRQYSAPRGRISASISSPSASSVAHARARCASARRGRSNNGAVGPSRSHATTWSAFSGGSTSSSAWCFSGFCLNGTSLARSAASIASAPSACSTLCARRRRFRHPMPLVGPTMSSSVTHWCSRCGMALKRLSRRSCVHSNGAARTASSTNLREAP